MSKIGDLVEQYCPNGVEYYTLGEVCSFKKGQSITSKDIVKGNIPVIAGGKSPAYYHNKANRFGETVAVSSSGAYAGFVSYWSIPVFLSDSFSVEPKDILLTKYLYYFLNNLQDYIYSLKSIGGIPHIYARNIDKFKIPVPPMPIQQEIVRILDKYSEFENKLEIKLQEEIDTRKKQYEYYRSRLLSFDSYTIKTKKIQMKPLSEVVCICNGKDHKHLKKGVYPVYGSGGIIRYVDTYIYNDVSVLLPRKGSVGNIFYVTTPFWTVDTIFFTKINKDLVEPKYLYYFLLNQHLEKMNLAVGVPSLTKMMLNKIVVAVPSLEEQRKIVELLDNYTSLEKELEIKLQEEIDNRKKQYEFYRNKLLTFSPKLKEDD